MAQERRKVLLYLRPEVNDGEQFASDKIGMQPQGERGNYSRTALMAGIALGELDSRLPALLAAMLSDHTSAEELRSFLGNFIQPRKAELVKNAAPVVEPSAPAAETPPAPLSHSGNILKNRFPD